MMSPSRIVFLLEVFANCECAEYVWTHASRWDLSPLQDMTFSFSHVRKVNIPRPYRLIPLSSV